TIITETIKRQEELLTNLAKSKETLEKLHQERMKDPQNEEEVKKQDKQLATLEAEARGITTSLTELSKKDIYQSFDTGEFNKQDLEHVKRIDDQSANIASIRSTVE